ncbi:unnamed protein product [Closterium sp. Naga37s-1]|nr:unnamed protein product [Closterium sp. Naga37s-1]
MQAPRAPLSVSLACAPIRPSPILAAGGHPMSALPRHESLPARSGGRVSAACRGASIPAAPVSVASAIHPCANPPSASAALATETPRLYSLLVTADDRAGVTHPPVFLPIVVPRAASALCCRVVQPMAGVPQASVCLPPAVPSSTDVLQACANASLPPRGPHGYDLHASSPRF